MNGYASASALREWAEPRGGLLVIAHTGTNELRDQAFTRESGFDDVLAKPVDFLHILRAVEAGLTQDSKEG